ncbi:MAG: shikimate kinase [Clostridia bacterium]|nr:shikimate kinase [Clostridia bacterium]
MNNLIICGFMGAGKTTLGIKLAEHFGMQFIDTDCEIVKRENRTIADIFATDGEPYFRKLETELIKELGRQKNLVISLGGGLAANKDNHKYLKAAGKVILLDCGIDVTLERITGDSTRPLTAGGREDIVARYNMRKPIYEEVADIIVDSSADEKRTFLTAVSAIEDIL